MKCIRHLAAIALMLAGGAAAAQQAPLRLDEAFDIAMTQSPTRKLALAGVKLADGEARQARAAQLPTLELNGSATAGDDPVYAFGTRLRQGRFAQADFAISSLNHPEALGDLSGGATAGWGLSLATPLRARAARLMLRASQKQLTRSEQELIYRVAVLYSAVQMAAREEALAEETCRTAEALAEAARTRVAAGTAVEADRMLAEVKLAERRQELTQARSRKRMAWADLEEALGASLPESRMPSAVDRELRPYETGIEEAVETALRKRPEQEQAALRTAAQREQWSAESWRRAATAQAFASWRVDASPTQGANGRAWLAGVELRLPLFDAGRAARRESERARLLQSEAQGEALRAQIRAEVKKAVIACDAARQNLELARASVQQAAESLRIVRDRYESGLAAITELLQAGDAEQSTRVNYWRAAQEIGLRRASALLATGEIDMTNAQEAITGGAQ